ncbi:MAG: ribonuclease P protein component [Phycisphaerae bacterium]
MRFFFRKHNRISGNETFRRIMKDGRCVCTGTLTVFLLPNSLECNRLGVSVGRKFGKAYVRNRYKRLVREAFRLNNQLLAENSDVVVLMHKKFSARGFDYRKVSFESVEKSLRYAFTREGNKHKA